MSTLALKLFRENQLSQSSFGISPLPTSHQALFNVPWFRSPVSFTSPSTCSWVGHMVFRVYDNANSLLELGFPYGSVFSNLASYRNSPGSFYKGTLSPINGLELVVGTRFRLFLPLGVLFCFPHGTGSLSVTRVFRVGRWSSDSDRIFSCPAVLRILLGIKTISNTRLLLSLADLPCHSSYSLEVIAVPTTPEE